MTSVKHRSPPGSADPLLSDSPIHAAATGKYPGDAEEGHFVGGGSLAERDPMNSSTIDRAYPKAVFFIIGNEFCERFSFYGMKTILYVYLKEYLRFEESRATSLLHVFVMFAYFFPLVGGALSDSYLGKFKTIVYLSLLYSVGNIVLAVTAIPGITGNPPHWWGAALGLFLLAIGTGGIKPCVSAFGGDQFHPSQVQEIQMFFSAFYFSVNFGSLLSTYITPEIRDLSCFGAKTCYPVAFGLPALLMIVACMVFIAGSKWYKITPPGGNVLAKVMSVVYAGLRTPSHSEGSHWLDSARSKFGRKAVHETKALLNVLFMFLPLPFFWALFDQQSSRWIEQAQRMNLDVPIFGAIWKIKADQMQIVNALLILVMIPLFQKGVYPLVNRLGIKSSPLYRMSAGMFLTGVAFIVTAILQLAIDKSTLAEIEQSDGSSTIHCVSGCVPIAYQLPQYVILTAGEILFSITGLEFAYSEAPDSMKSVCQAAWLLTVAVGNLLVAVVASSSMFNRAAYEFLFFAALIFAAMLVFMIMSRYYVSTPQYMPVSGEEYDEAVDLLSAASTEQDSAQEDGESQEYLDARG
eukprot:Partr_v1_DN28174_c0_g1_i2_m55502 putative solute carrier family 15